MTPCLLNANEHEYVEEKAYPALPDTDKLQDIDWPVKCRCVEKLTPNHINTGVKMPEDGVGLECPNSGCERETSISRPA